MGKLSKSSPTNFDIGLRSDEYMKKLSAETGMSVQQCKRFVYAMWRVLLVELERRGSVTIPWLGRFYVQFTQGYLKSNTLQPNPDEKIYVASRNNIKFKMSGAFNTVVNGYLEQGFINWQIPPHELTTEEKIEKKEIAMKQKLVAERDKVVADALACVERKVKNRNRRHKAGED